LQDSIVHVVDGDAKVADQTFEFEEIYRNDLDVTARFACLQGLLDSFKRISMSKYEGSLLGRKLHFNDVSIHPFTLLAGPLPATDEWQRAI
jgi:poly-beta-hydroxyalkanoate depolymerase